MSRIASLLALTFMVITLTGCKTAYYGMMETFGYQKRDLLVSSVKEAQASQEAAKVEFKDALEKFRSVVNIKDPDTAALESLYDKLKSKLASSEAQAADVTKRINEVKSVSADLFAEWEKELAQYQSAELRRQSESQMRETKRRYDQLIGAMERAESKMQPVLTMFKDQVLFLKHNLNAKAIASLQTVVKGLEGDTAVLIADMEKSIAEAEAFVKEMK